MKINILFFSIATLLLTFSFIENSLGVISLPPTPHGAPQCNLVQERDPNGNVVSCYDDFNNFQCSQICISDLGVCGVLNCQPTSSNQQSSSIQASLTSSTNYAAFEEIISLQISASSTNLNRRIVALGYLSDGSWEYCCTIPNCGYSSSNCQSTSSHTFSEVVSHEDLYNNVDHTVTYYGVVYDSPITGGPGGIRYCPDGSCLTKSINILRDVTLSSPQNGAILNNPRPTLEWNSVQGANYYHVYVDVDDSERTRRFSPCTSLNQVQVSTDLGDGNYLWSAKACRDIECRYCSNYASERSFTIDTQQPTVSISILPQQPTATTNVTYTATASDNVGVIRTKIYINENNDDFYEVQPECNAPTCSITRGPYQAGQRIRYYALARDAAGNQGDSGTREFTTVDCVTDAHCPSNRPHCVNNQCVECVTNAHCVALGRTCEPSYPNRYARCNTATYTCSVCGECAVNSDCTPGYCCPKEGNPGPGNLADGQCFPTSTSRVYTQNPRWLCASG
ncbi:MAG: hypothetical protein QXO27_02705 [Candidatus Aenigmatarchaeota archaeon]